MMSSHLRTQAFSGVANVLASAAAAFDPLAVEVDIEAEQESIQPRQEDDTDSDDDMDIGSDDSNNHGMQEPSSSGIPAQWRETMAHASTGVTDNTHREYIRLSEACIAFLLEKDLISRKEDFLTSKPPPLADKMIIAWIMSSCDTIGLDGKPAVGPRGTYGHAQKMRASMTHVFSRMLGLGSHEWQQVTLPHGKVHVQGNPSISGKVASYMIGLRRRKVQNGETTTSARAITTDIMSKLYDYNHEPGKWDIPEGTAGYQSSSNIHQWGGPVHRRAAQAIYTIAFVCMLRIDEVLKIRMSHLDMSEDNKITLVLPFRKTHQFGEIKPFVLYKLEVEEHHLCPVRAIYDWIAATGITTGYLFRRMASGDRPTSNDVAMSSEQFLEIFRNNLIDVNIDPSPYGTHSFRRGGCQYFASDRRWKLRRICDWGGWSTEFSSLTIVKYLISWNDEPEESRDNFLNPNQPPSKFCGHCGRSCPCA